MDFQVQGYQALEWIVVAIIWILLIDEHVQGRADQVVIPIDQNTCISYVYD
jgi:hypothetical protein